MEESWDTNTKFLWMRRRRMNEVTRFQHRQGDTYLATKAKNMPHLQCLSRFVLSSSEISDKGVQILSVMLLQLPALTVLDLKNNKIGNFGAKVLLAVLPRCPALTSLDLEGNPVDEAIKREITSVLGHNKLLSEGFLAAAASGNLALLKDFLFRGAAILSRDENQNTALHLSARAGHLDVVTFLYINGISVFVRNSEDKTPETLADEANQVTASSYLMQRAMEAVGLMKSIPSAPPLTEPLPVLHDGAGVNALPSAPVIGANTELNLRESAKPPYIDFENIALREQPIASGGMGVIYQGILKQEGAVPHTVAVKMLVAAQRNNEKLIAAIQKEYDILGALYHSHVVQVLGYSTNKSGSFCLVMDYYPHGSLSEYLFLDRWNTSLLWRLSCAEQVGKGLAFLHMRGLLHLDLKPENILLADNWRAVIADFGISRSLQTEHTHCSTSTPPAGTVPFIAPEILCPSEGEEKTHYSKPNDVFSLAVLIWCCMSLRRPFEGWNYFRIMMEVGNKQRREKIPEHTPESVARLIGRSWAHDALLRPTAEEVSRALSELCYEEYARNPSGYSSPMRK